MSKKGSATLVIIMSALIFMLYATSTYSDVRHLKNSYENYKKDIINKYEQEYNNKVQEL